MIEAVHVAAFCRFGELERNSENAMTDTLLDNAGDEGGNGALHVAGSTAIQNLIAHGGIERIMAPIRCSCRHDVGMAGETQMRPVTAPPSEEVFDGTEAKAVHGEAEGDQALGQDRLCPAIGGRDRGTADERLR